jgi:hypothetical protein
MVDGRRVGLQVDAGTGLGDAGGHVGLVQLAARADQRHAKGQRDQRVPL